MKKKILPIALSAALTVFMLPAMALADVDSEASGADASNTAPAENASPSEVPSDPSDDSMGVAGDSVIADEAVDKDSEPADSADRTSSNVDAALETSSEPEGGSDQKSERDATNSRYISFLPNGQTGFDVTVTGGSYTTGDSGVMVEKGATVILTSQSGYYFREKPSVNTGEHVGQNAASFFFKVGESNEDLVVTVYAERMITDISGIPSEIPVGKTYCLSDYAVVSPSDAYKKFNWYVDDPGTTGAVIDDPASGSLTAESEGVVRVRVVAPAYTKTFDISVRGGELSAPQVSIDYVDAMLVFDSVEDSYEILVDGDVYTTLVGGSYPIEEAWFGSSVSVVRVEYVDGVCFKSDSVEVAIPVRPEAPSNLSVVNESKSGAEDGKLTGLDPDAHYLFASEDGSTWMDVQGVTEITGLASGEYLIKYAAAPGVSFDSEFVTYVVGHDSALSEDLNAPIPPKGERNPNLLVGTNDGLGAISLASLAVASLMALAICGLVRKRME